MLEQGLTQRSQARGKAELGQGLNLQTLVGRKGLEGHLQAFLLACQVDNFSNHTILDYRKKIGQFIRFAATIGVNEPKA